MSMNFFKKIGLPSHLFWGYVGLFFFILGATLEQSWFSAYTSELGFSVSQTSLIFTAFGIFGAIAAWFTGTATQIWGVRRIMWLGVIIFYVSSAAMLFWALPTKSYAAILVTYMLRGASYPLFGYSFLVWVNYRTKKEILARACSWFWTFFTIGMGIIGPYYAGALIPWIGEIGVMKTGFIFVALGAIFGLILNRDKIVIPKPEASPAKEFIESITIMFKRPKLGLGVIIKTANDTGKYAFLVILPTFLLGLGFSTSEWLTVWGSINIVNIFANYLFGYLGDKIGWRKVVILFSGTLCGIGTLLIYFLPTIFGHNVVLLFIALSIFGIGLSGYGPLSALMPYLAPDKKGIAISCLNLGCGLSTFVGPMIVSIFEPSFGVKGTMFVIAGFHFLSSILAYFLKTPEESGQVKA